MGHFIYYHRHVVLYPVVTAIVLFAADAACRSITLSGCWCRWCAVLAVKAFAFSPRLRCLAVRRYSSQLLATALIVPYLKRSQRALKTTFVNP